jgi:CubicO group peptidase (beta-lactamase class C family)
MRLLFSTLLMLLAGSEEVHTSPGAVAIVSELGKPDVVNVQGLGDLENNVPLAANSVFRIASLTKQFTAVAILALVEDGRLSLEDTLGRRLRDCPDLWRAITVRQLLSHTSGLTGDMAPVLARMREDHTPQDLLTAYATLPLEAQPGSRWRYSNLNYWILGRVIEETTGLSYARFVEERVLNRAGLRQTRYGSTSELIRRRVRGVTKGDDGRWLNPPYFSATIGYAAGGFVSTAEDLARWYRALSAGKVVALRMIDLAKTEVRTADGGGTGYGLGWYVQRRCGSVVLHHGGSSPGFAAYMVWEPKRGLFAAVLTNHDDQGEPKAWAWRLIRDRLSCPRADFP